MPQSEVIYLRHMIDAAEKAIAFTQGQELADLESDDMLALAVVRLLEILGEAGRNVSDDIKEAHPEIPWRSIVGTRNRLIHGYFEIDLDIVWAIVEQDLPDLVPRLERIIDELSAPQS